MTGSIWLILLDMVVGALLVATLFFAIRLSRQLKDFRAGRADLDQLVKDLSLQVNNAERAVQGLKETARASGRELQDRIDKAKSYSDELQLVSESATNLAGRLERGATAKPRKSEPFAIHEPDNNLPKAALRTDSKKPLSRAEQELSDALRARKNQSGAA